MINIPRDDYRLLLTLSGDWTTAPDVCEFASNVLKHSHYKHFYHQSLD